MALTLKDFRESSGEPQKGEQQLRISSPAGMLALQKTVEVRRLERSLTIRQIKHLEVISRGYSQEEEATEFDRTLEAVKSMRQKIISKTPKGSLARAAFESILVGEIHPEPDSPLPARLLSRRQQDVADQICLGFSNEEIAANLGLGVETVKTHVVNILEKLEAKNRNHVPRRMFETGTYILPSPVVNVG